MCVYNFIPDVLTELSGLCGEVGVCLIEWVNVSTGNEWRTGGLLEEELIGL